MQQKTFTTKDKVSLFYLYHFVDPKKPFLIFIHGAGSNHTIYKPFFTAFKNHNFIAVDLVNHGKSGYRDVSAVTIHSLADDIWQLCIHERIKEVIIIGNCLGASIAVEFYKRHKRMVKKTVLMTLFSTRYVRKAWLLRWIASIFYRLLKPFSGKRILKFQDYHKRPIWYYPLLDIRGTPVTTVVKLVKELLTYNLYVYNLTVPSQIIVAVHDWSTKNSLIHSDCHVNRNITIIDVKSHHVPLSRICDEIIQYVKVFIE